MKHTRAIACLALLMLCACQGGGGGPSPKPPYAGIKIGRPYQVYGIWYEPKYNAHYDETGVASWYGPGFHGGRTASGERFDQDALTAAHKTLPLPSIVRVTNLDNGLTTLVTVNDRGPFSHGRIIDLSRASATKLGVIRTGTARVRVQFLEKETREYVTNLGAGEQYAQMVLKNVNPTEAAEREEAGARPSLHVEGRMFAQDATPGGAQNFLPPSAPQPQQHPIPGGLPVALSDDDDKDDSDEFSMANDTHERKAAPPRSVKTPPQPAAQSPFVSPANTGFFIKVGTFSVQQNAYDLIDRLTDADAPQAMEVIINGKKYYRVMVGPYNSQDAAKNMLSKLTSLGISDAKIIHN